MKEINKVCNWKEFVAKYPNKWAFISDIKRRDGKIVKCKVLMVCTFEEKDSYIPFYRSQNIDFDCVRTTFSAPTLGVML